MLLTAKMKEQATIVAPIPSVPSPAPDPESGRMNDAKTNVDESSDAYEKGIRAGDIITDAGQKKISDVAELEAQIVATREAGRQSVLVLVRREGQPRFVVLSVE